MKNRSIEIETPEKIKFRYTISQSGTRAGSWIIDFMIQFLFSLLVIFLFISYSAFDPDELDTGRSFIWAFFLLVYFFFQWGYYILFETILNGQTPGKKLLKISVIEESGESLKFSTIVLRNLLRAVDLFPGFYLLGGLVSISDSKSRRIGDMIARTLVVENTQGMLKEPDMSVYISRSTAALVSNNNKKIIADRLSEEELWMLRRFLNDRLSLPADQQEKIGKVVAEKLRKRLGVAGPIVNPIRFIEKTYKEQTNEER